MSTLGGILNFYDAPPNQQVLNELAQGLAARSPDGGGQVRKQCAALVYRGFHTTQASRREVQPAVSRAGNVICWDGRLDNRNEIATALEIDCETSDVDLVLASYEKWGLAFAEKLLGDFALSLWDSRTRTLILARDPIGPRALFYVISDNRIIWSSLLLPLIDLGGTSPEIDEDYIACYLTRDYNAELTPYQGIHAVPPGHQLIVQIQKVTLKRFWQPDFSRQIRYRNDSEYEEHFYRLFQESVRCRLRADLPVMAQLSGGLDSSAIVCMARRLTTSGQAETPTINTVSYVYDESQSSNEDDFIRCVEESCEITGYHLKEADHSPLAGSLEHRFNACPDFLDCFARRHEGLCDAMRRAGARVLLTGHGGDEMLHSGATPSPALRDLVSECQLLKVHQSLKTWSQVLKKSYLHLLWREGLVPRLPLPLQTRCVSNVGLKLPSWLNADFVLHMNMDLRNLGPKIDFVISRPSDLEQLRSFLSAARTVSNGAFRDRGLIETAHPYLDLRLVEFLFSIPFDQKVRPGQTRSLMRRALKDLLPEKVLIRRSKRGPEEAFFRAVRREWPWLRLLFEKPLVCSRGYMNARRLQAALDRARHGCELQSFALIKTISLEFWLRALEQRSSSANNLAMTTTLERVRSW